MTCRWWNESKLSATELCEINGPHVCLCDASSPPAFCCHVTTGHQVRSTLAGYLIKTWCPVGTCTNAALAVGFRDCLHVINTNQTKGTERSGSAGRRSHHFIALRQISMSSLPRFGKDFSPASGRAAARCYGNKRPLHKSPSVNTALHA